MALAPLLAVGCVKKETAPAGTRTDRLPRLETIRPERGPRVVQSRLVATVDALDKADLCARVPGTVESFRLDANQPEVDIGRRVKAGEPLVKIAVPDIEADLKLKQAMREQAQNQRQLATEAANVATHELEEAKHMLSRYQADYTLAAQTHDRTSKLVQSGALQPQNAEETRSKLESATAAYEAARVQIQTREAKIAAAKADLAVAESKIRVAQAEIDRLKVLLGFSTVKAPFDGVVTRRWVDPGAMIKDPSLPVLTVMQTDRVRVLIDIPERDVPFIKPADRTQPGNAVTLHIPALAQTSAAGGDFSGHITRIASALDPRTRTMRAEVELPNHEHRLRPNMTGEATLVLEDLSNVLTIPSTALVRFGNRMNVYYLDQLNPETREGVVKHSPVQLGLDDGQRVEVRSGLHGDELIIAKGSGVIHTGDHVIAVPAEKMRERARPAK